MNLEDVYHYAMEYEYSIRMANPEKDDNPEAR